MPGMHNRPPAILRAYLFRTSTFCGMQDKFQDGGCL